jgi:hypothetical protein
MLTTYTKPRPWSWSFSKLKNFQNCPRRYHEIDVLKRVKEEESETLAYGKFVHTAFARRLQDKTPLPSGLSHYEPLMAKLERVPGELLVEDKAKLAITAEFEPCEFFDKEKTPWLRMIADVLVIAPPVALAVDFKLGKVLEDSQQLALLSACIFARWPEVLAVRTEYWWLKDDAISRADFKRADMPSVWRAVFPRIEQLKHAHDTNNFPPKPSGLCKRYCPVKSCEHHGK